MRPLVKLTSSRICNITSHPARRTAGVMNLVQMSRSLRVCLSIWCGGPPELPQNSRQRFHHLVALAPMRDLLLRAKHLLIAACWTGTAPRGDGGAEQMSVAFLLILIAMAHQGSRRKH